MTRFARLATCTICVAIGVTLASCGGLPRPRTAADSLVIIAVEHDRPQTRTAVERTDHLVLSDGTEETRVALDRDDATSALLISPGRYEVVRRESTDRNMTRQFSPSERITFEVPPSTVVLAPIVLLWSGDYDRDMGIGARPIHPDDQRRAATGLRSDVRFTSWAGRSADGFAPFSPFEDFSVERFEVTVSTDPPGARVVINGEYWGDSPVEVHLPRGKHYAEHRLDGHETAQSYLTVDGPGRSDARLVAHDRDVADSAGETRVVVVRFTNLGNEADDYLAELFTDSIVVALSDEGLEPIRSDDPDDGLATAEQIGAQLIVTGDILEDQGRLVTHAVLADVRTEVVKAALLLERPGGFAVFDSIDTIADEFASSVTRVLPDVGRSVIEERPVTAESIAYRERLTEQVVIRRRIAEEHVLSLSAIYGAVMDHIEVAWRDDSVSRQDGPAGGASLTYELPLSLPLSLAVKVNPYWPRNFDNGDVAFGIGVYTGPRYSFYNLGNDIYLSMLLAGHWAGPSGLYNWESEELEDLPASVIASVVADVGIKLYLRPGRRAQSRFVDLGFTLGIAGLRWWADFSDRRFFGPEIWLNAGIGRRL